MHSLYQRGCPGKVDGNKKKSDGEAKKKRRIGL
jgi:hypothetical protein